VLQVDANVIHKVDTTNPENLFSMWTGEFLPACAASTTVHTVTNHVCALQSLRGVVILLPKAED
jgi:hypothetical protein